MKAYAWSAVCTDFLSAYGQSIVPAQKNLRRTLGQPEGAPRASVVSPPPQVAALPSNRLWPHAACQGHSRHKAQATRFLLGMTPLSPFVPARRVITPGMIADGSRLPCRALGDCIGLAAPRSGPSPRTPPALPRRFYSGHSPPLRHFTATCCYFHLADQARHRVATPGSRSGSCVSVGLQS